MLFRVGQVVWTQGILRSAFIGSTDLVEAFARYIRGDWGEVSAERGLQNDVAIASGGVIQALYSTPQGAVFCMRTEAGRTMVYLPEECADLDTAGCPRRLQESPRARAAGGTSWME